jgi:hypothetical protein
LDPHHRSPAIIFIINWHYYCWVWKNISAFLILSYPFHFRCAHFNLDDVQNLGHHYLKSCLWGWICIFYLLIQTWLEEEDKEEGANERGKQHHQGCWIQVKLWIHTRHLSRVVKFDIIRPRFMYMLRGRNNTSQSCDLQEEIHVINFNWLFIIFTLQCFCSSNSIANGLHLGGGGSVRRQEGITIGTVVWSWGTN